MRTPEERFRDLPDFSHTPRFTDVGGLQVAHVEAGPAEAPPVVMLHGEPTWSFLYRKMIPIIAQAGLRAIAPDLMGCGRSDKPTEESDYTYQRHVAWMHAWLEANRLEQITLVCQDWGSLIGLRLAAEAPGRFARILLMNGGLPVGLELPQAFQQWLAFSQSVEGFPVGRIVNAGCKKRLSPGVKAAYDAPFPDERYKAGVRAFPRLVPTRPDDPAVKDNKRAWVRLMRWEKPFLTAFSDGDPITRGGEAPFQEHVPGARGQPHVTVEGAGHFLQEDRGEFLGQVVVDFVARKMDF